MALLLIALFGLFVPNGLFIYWLFNEFSSIGDALNNRLALAFIIDAFMVLGLLAYWFAKNPARESFVVLVRTAFTYRRVGIQPSVLLLAKRTSCFSGSAIGSIKTGLTVVC